MNVEDVFPMVHVPHTRDALVPSKQIPQLKYFWVGLWGGSKGLNLEPPIAVCIRF